MPDNGEAVAPDGKEMYGFCTVQEFNVAWEKSGHKDKADIPVSVKVKGDERSHMGRL